MNVFSISKTKCTNIIRTIIIMIFFFLKKNQKKRQINRSQESGNSYIYTEWW